METASYTLQYEMIVIVSSGLRVEEGKTENL